MNNNFLTLPADQVKDFFANMRMASNNKAADIWLADVSPSHLTAVLDTVDDMFSMLEYFSIAMQAIPQAGECYLTSKATSNGNIDHEGICANCAENIVMCLNEATKYIAEEGSPHVKALYTKAKESVSSAPVDAIAEVLAKTLGISIEEAMEMLKGESTQPEQSGWGLPPLGG